MSYNRRSRLSLPASAVNQEYRQISIVDVWVGCDKSSRPYSEGTARGKPEWETDDAHDFSRRDDDGRIAYAKGVWVELHVIKLRQAQRDNISLRVQSRMLDPQRLAVGVERLDPGYPLSELIRAVVDDPDLLGNSTRMREGLARLLVAPSNIVSIRNQHRTNGRHGNEGCSSPERISVHSHLDEK
jgi:hypothetical protein